MKKVNRKPVYYYDGNTTVCLLMDNGIAVARGISICSRADEFCGEYGREQARKRALEAYGRESNCEEIKLDAPRMNWCDYITLSLANDRYGGFKGTYMPTLSPTEELITRKSYILKDNKPKIPEYQLVELSA